MKLLEGIEKREWWIKQQADGVYEGKLYSTCFDQPVNGTIKVIDSAYVEKLEAMLKLAVEQRDFIYKCWENDDIKHWYGSAREFTLKDNAELRAIAEEKR